MHADMMLALLDVLELEHFTERGVVIPETAKRRRCTFPGHGERSARLSANAKRCVFEEMAKLRRERNACDIVAELMEARADTALQAVDEGERWRQDGPVAACFHGHHNTLHYAGGRKIEYV